MKNESFAINTLSADKIKTQLLLEGLLIIRNAAIIKKELLAALANSQNLELIIKDVAKVDTAFLQLLVALQKSAAIADKKVAFDIEASDYMKSVVKNSGFENYLSINSAIS